MHECVCEYFGCEMWVEICYACAWHAICFSIVSSTYTNFFGKVVCVCAWNFCWPAQLSAVIAPRYELSTWVACNALGNKFKCIWNNLRNSAPLWLLALNYLHLMAVSNILVFFFFFLVFLLQFYFCCCCCILWPFYFIRVSHTWRILAAAAAAGWPKVSMECKSGPVGLCK